MATAPATKRLPNIKGWVYDNEDSYCRVEDEESREMVTDAYDPAKTYKKGETSIQDNKLYRAKADITTAEIWTPNHWEETSLETIRAEMAAEISKANSDISALNANKVLEVYTIHTSELLAIKTKNLIIITGKLIIKYEIASNNGWLFNIVDNAELFSDSNMQVVYLPKYSGGYAQVAFKKTLDNNSKNVLQCTTAYSGDPITAGEEVIVNIVFATKS